MAKGKTDKGPNYDSQNTTQKTKDWAVTVNIL